jgi:hypothetical protein
LTFHISPASHHSKPDISIILNSKIYLKIEPTHFQT